MVEVVEKHQLEVLHVHYAIPHAYAAYMAKQMLKEKGISVKVVTTLHGTDITLVGSHPTYKTAVEFSINNSDVVTAVSNDLKKQLIDFLKLKKILRLFIILLMLKSTINADQECKRIALANLMNEF